MLWYWWSFILKSSSSNKWVVFHPSVVFDDIGCMSGKWNLFPGTQVYHGMGMTADKGDRHVSRGVKGIRCYHFYYRLKNHAWAGTMSKWEIWMWAYTLGILCTVLWPMQELTCIRYELKWVNTSSVCCDELPLFGEFSSVRNYWGIFLRQNIKGKSLRRLLFGFAKQ